MFRLRVFSTMAGKEVRLLFSALVILAIILGTFPGCSTEETKLVHLKVVDLPYPSFTTFYIAQEEGYFAEQGLEVEFVKFSSVTQSIPLLAQGELDVAAGSVSAGFFNAIEQGVNVKIVAGREYTTVARETAAFMVRKSLYESGELDTVAEIEGRQIAMTCTACVNDFALTQILKTAGLTQNDVNIVKLSAEDIVVALGNGGVDAALIGTPRKENIEDMGYGVFLTSFAQLMPDFQYAFMMFGPTMLGDNAELGKRFMTAYLKGVRQYVQGKTERNLEIAQKYTGFDRETLLEMAWNPVDVNGSIDLDDIIAFQDWAYESGFVDKEVSAEQLIDTSFIDYANGVLGPATETPVG